MTKVMKAAVLRGPRSIILEERGVPEIRPDEVLVRVKICGICGSDIAYYSRGRTEGAEPPIVLGHEFVGTIVDLGQKAKETAAFKPSDRVVIEPIIPCRMCSACKQGIINLCSSMGAIGVSRDGGFAEYCKVPYDNVHLLPMNISYEEGAFTEPLACAAYGIKKMRISPGDFCVVVGPGPIGLMMLQYIKAHGAEKVALVGTRDYRLEAGEKLGADYLINVRDKSSKYFTEDPASKIREWSGRGADAVIVASGNIDANELGISVGGPRSRIVLFGGAGYRPEDLARINLWQGTLRDMEIIFSWLAPYIFPDALKAISARKVKVKPLITHTFPLTRVGEAIETAQERLGNALKVQIEL